MLAFLKLIRYQNLLMLALMQLVFRYGFFTYQEVSLALTNFQYFLLILATVCIAAGGYVINNIEDQKTDLDNKPQNVVVGKIISEERAFNIYIILNCIGVAIGFYLSNVILKPGFASIFIFTAATLYLYATSLKQMILLGNITIAFLLAFSVLLVGIFDLYPATNATNQSQMAVLFSILLDYAIFTFMVNFLREMVKDLEDVNGDYNQGISTLPIAIGINRTTKVVFTLSFIPLISLFFYLYKYLNNLRFASLYLLLSVAAPLIFFTVKIFTSTKSKEFHNLSQILKLILLFGILSIIAITLNMKYNA